MTHGIRLAREPDETPVFELLRFLYDENGMLTMSDAKVMKMIQQGTRSQGGVIGVAEEEGAIVGCAALVIEQPWYTDEWILCERGVVVHPEKRASHHAENLIKFCKEAAGLLKLPLVIGILSTVRTQGKERFYDRHMKRAGAFFVDGLERAHGPMAARSLEM